ncbi:MAG: AEC family transporter [Clostridia bacterium]|nr:AEC family transporter [Clostridia bacterium]
MNFFPKLLAIMITLFLLMICGYICRKKKIIDTSASKALSRLIITIGQPMLIINALANATFDARHIQIAWQVLCISLAMHTLMALMAFLICKLLKKNPDQNKIFEFSLVFANAGFIGFPILDSIFGGIEPGLGSFMGAFYVIAFHLFIWTWGIMILARGREDIKLTPKKIFVNYGTVPCAVGLLIFIGKGVLQSNGIADLAFMQSMQPFFSACGSFFSYLGSLCTPISVLVTGALLATIPFSKMFTNGKLYLHSAIKLFAFPAIICLLAKLVFGLILTANPAALSPQTVEIYILLATAMAGVPSAATITMLAELYDIEPAYASQSVGMTSIISTASLPLVMLFAQWVVGW